MTKNTDFLIHNIKLAATLASRDILSKYRRSMLGPFWLTINMSVTIVAIGLVFSSLLGSSMEEFLPFLAVGFILWTFIAGTINDGCSAFIEAESIIKQFPIPLFVFILRILWKNVFILAHNILILPGVFLFYSKSLSVVALLSIPALFLVLLFLSWIASSCAILSARYRDSALIVSNLLQVVFFLTPIMWMPSSLLTHRVKFLEWNPFYHLVELIRSPLLGQAPSLTSWFVILGIALPGCLFALFVFTRTRARVVYWL